MWHLQALSHSHCMDSIPASFPISHAPCVHPQSYILSHSEQGRWNGCSKLSHARTHTRAASKKILAAWELPYVACAPILILACATCAQGTFNWRIIKNCLITCNVYDKELNYKPFDFAKEEKFFAFQVNI